MAQSATSVPSDDHAGLRLILISPPGAGKGTHAQALHDATGVTHISSGDLLRAEVASGSALGRDIAEYSARGDLVPDEVIFEVLVPTVRKAVEQTGGYLLDGFPRTLAQAHRAAEIGVEEGLSVGRVLALDAPTEVLVERLLDRATREGRADDTIQVIRHRMAVYEKETAPLLEYYRGRGLLIEVDANRPQVTVQHDIFNRLGVHLR